MLVALAVGVAAGEAVAVCTGGLDGCGGAACTLAAGDGAGSEAAGEGVVPVFGCGWCAHALMASTGSTIPKTQGRCIER